MRGPSPWEIESSCADSKRSNWTLSPYGILFFWKLYVVTLMEEIWEIKNALIYKYLINSFLAKAIHWRSLGVNSDHLVERLAFSPLHLWNSYYKGILWGNTLLIEMLYQGVWEKFLLLYFTWFTFIPEISDVRSNVTIKDGRKGGIYIKLEWSVFPKLQISLQQTLRSLK